LHGGKIEEAKSVEEVTMEFSIECPTDGEVRVGLQNVVSIVVRGSDALEVVFGCPVCGAELRVMAQVPRMLLATLEDAVVVDERTGEHTISVAGLIERGLIPAEAAEALAGETAGVGVSGKVPEVDEERIERYVEYFRRQLATVQSADAILTEIDSK
jgi:hypothetical protein